MSQHHLSAAARVAIALAIIMPTAAALGVAQVPTIPAGTRVRVAAQPNGLTGTVKSQSVDSIAVETTDSVRTVPLAWVSRIEVSRGVSHLDGGIRGMKIGGLGLGGTVAALLIAAYVASPDNNCNGADECLDPAAAMLILVPAATILGGATGFVIGSLVGAEHWDRVYPVPARVSILPARNGRTLIGLSIGF